MISSPHLHAWAVCGASLLGIALLPRLGFAAGEEPTEAAETDEDDPSLDAARFFDMLCSHASRSTSS